MKFKITTDYAIRIIIHLDKCSPQVLNAKKASKELAITYSYFTKVACQIKNAGFIESIQGSTGGYRLARDSKQISLYDIIETMEGGIFINTCLDEKRFCSRNAIKSCPVHETFNDIQNHIIEYLKGITIYDLNKKWWKKE